MSGPRQAFIGVGANLGDRERSIRNAIEHLENTPGIQNVRLSHLYETAPVGVIDQPKFFNAAAGLETTLSPEELLDALLAIERRMGRVRNKRWGPRTIDLDLLLYEGEARKTDHLTLPHPRLRERPFVVIPLLELLGNPPYDRPPWKNLAAELKESPAAQHPEINRKRP